MAPVGICLTQVCLTVRRAILAIALSMATNPPLGCQLLPLTFAQPGPRHSSGRGTVTPVAKAALSGMELCPPQGCCPGLVRLWDTG